MKRWQLISSKTVFENRWIDLECNKYQKPNGELVNFFINKGARIVSVLGITDKKYFVAVKQYRPAINEFTIDLPGGAVGKKESLIKAAKREFKEETGLLLTDVKSIISVYHDSGRSNQIKQFLLGNVDTSSLVRTSRNTHLHDDCELILIPINKFLSELNLNHNKRIYEPSLIMAIIFYRLFSNVD